MVPFNFSHTTQDSHPTFLLPTVHGPRRLGCCSRPPQRAFATSVRAAFPGIAYQIGNAILSPAAEIVTGISEHTLVLYKGKRVEAFGPTMGIATTIIVVSLAFWTAVGM